MRTTLGRAVAGGIPVVVVFVATLGVLPAKATPVPSFSGVAATAGDQHDVTVTFTETGLGSAQTVIERLTAKARDAYACYSPTGDRSGSTALIERPSAEAQYQANAGGSIDSASITISVQPENVCPKGQISYLYKTVFRGLLLTDVTNDVSVSVPGKFTSCSPTDCQPPAHL
jgi:hypothetical protein